MQVVWPVCSALLTIFKRNVILALYMKSSKKDVYVYKKSGGSLWPFTWLRKECYLTRSYIDVFRKRKTDFYGWARISAIGEAWLTYNADVQCTAEGRQETKEQRKKIMFTVFLSCFKILIFISLYRHINMGI